MRPVPVLWVATLVVLTTVGAGALPAQDGDLGSQPTSTSTPAENGTGTATPEEDVIGWENGYWYNDSIAVDNADGLNDSELQAVRDRAMARVEYIRKKEFKSTPEFEFITRQEHRSRSTAPFDSVPRNDQFFEVAFIVGEDTNSVAARDQLTDVVVDGTFIERIRLVKDDPDSPQIDPLTLAHELTHALTRQHDSAAQAADRPSVRDWHLALGATFEGEAMWVEGTYEQYCHSEWECIELPGDRNDAVPDESVNMGLYLDFAAKYTLGKPFVARHYERNGIEGVNQITADPPQSSEQVIHPEKYGVDPPTNVTVRDRSGDDWRRIEPGEFTVPKTYNFGEAGLYVMLWYGGIIETEPVDVTKDQLTGLDYSHPATAGWDGDTVAVYRNFSAYGYVFESVWDTEDDAREFHEAYLDLLESKGAERVADDTYRIPDGPYADAFRVVREGTTLRVVNAPTVDDLDSVHAGPGSNTTTATPTASPSATGTADASPDSPESSEPSPTSSGQPGFGPIATVAGLLVAVLLARRR